MVEERGAQPRVRQERRAPSQEKTFLYKPTEREEMTGKWGWECRRR